MGSEVVELKLEGMGELASTLAYCMSESLAERGAFALAKGSGVVIDTSAATTLITINFVLDLAKRCLEEVGLRNKYVAYVEDGKIILRATDEEAVRRVALRLSGQLSEINMCPHCGFSTPYPELLREHIKIHYIF